VVVVKPQTFMNACGPAVAAWAADLDVPAERVVVIHDDLDLPAGRLRVVSGGGAGGHRGVASIHAAFGTQSIARVRLGIGRPPASVEAADFVLQAFPAEEQEAMAAAAARAAAAVKQIVTEGLAASMNRHNAAPRDAEGKAAGDESTKERRGVEGG
jgi:PTH1 family peptidyl-tRNA hydrolase